MIDLTNSESKAGATAALEIILRSRIQKLRAHSKDTPSQNGPNQLKMPKNVEEVPDDAPETTETETEKSVRMQKIKDDASEKKARATIDQIRQQTALKRDQIQQEKNAKIKAAKNAVDKLAQMQKSGSKVALNNFNNFKSDLLRCIGQQLKASKRQIDTYNKPNAKFAGTNLLVPVQSTVERYEKPIINLYFDVSGSIDNAAMAIATDAVKALEIYKRKKLCDFKIYFFANTIGDTPSRLGSGTHAFPAILEHIKDTRANNVLIITDEDFDYQTDYKQLTPIQVKGCVW